MNTLSRISRIRGSVALLTGAVVAAAGCAPSAPPAADPAADPTGDRNGIGCPAGQLYDLCARSATQARSDTAARALKFAMHQVGRPYSQANRKGPGSYDCSGLIWRAYAEAGIDIGADLSATLVQSGGPRHAIAVADAAPGDIIGYPGHVAIKLTDGHMVEAAKPGTNVRVRSIYSGFDRAAFIHAA